MSTAVNNKKSMASTAFIAEGPGTGNGNGGWGGGWAHNRSNYSLPIHPAKLGLWLFIMASMMLFAAFTSAYIVRSGAGDWLHFSLPMVMWFGTAALILSSVSIHLALKSIKANKYNTFRQALIATAFLGGIFIGGQFLGWNHLRSEGVYLTTNASSSFFYMLTAVHIVHLVGAGIALAFVIIKGFLHRYNAQNFLGVELCATYWHFLDALWIYLFIFLLIV